MLPNGISHQLADDDQVRLTHAMAPNPNPKPPNPLSNPNPNPNPYQDGVEKILRWLSYVPATASEQVWNRQ